MRLSLCALRPLANARGHASAGALRAAKVLGVAPASGGLPGAALLDAAHIEFVVRAG